MNLILYNQESSILHGELINFKNRIQMKQISSYLQTQKFKEKDYQITIYCSMRSFGEKIIQEAEYIGLALGMSIIQILEQMFWSQIQRLFVLRHIGISQIWSSLFLNAVILALLKLNRTHLHQAIHRYMMQHSILKK